MVMHSSICQTSQSTLLPQSSTVTTKKVLTQVPLLQPYDTLKHLLVIAPPVDDKLHVILTIFNAAAYTRRYELVREFINRVERYDRSYVILYVVELAYGNKTHRIACKNNPRHLQLRTAIPLWHKENLINLGVKTLLPKDWRVLAWIDADIEFDSPTWALDTLRLLGNGSFDLVQLFSHGVELDSRGYAIRVYTGFGLNHLRGIPYRKTGIDMWHPGYAWACTRKAYEQVGGLFESNILGGSDQSTAYAILGMHAKLPDTLKMFPSPGYKQTILKWEEKFHGLHLGYVPGIVNHHFHGLLKNRRYWERRDMLSDVAFDPQVHVQRDPESGVLVPTKHFPKKLEVDILAYFKGRMEDEEEGPNLAKTYGTSGHNVMDPHFILQNSVAVDTLLHVIVLIFPLHPTKQDFLDAKLYHILVADYLRKFSSTYVSPHLELYVVEMAYSQLDFYHTTRENPRHFQIHLPVKGVWSKGKVLNLVVDKLLPEHWQAMAYVDAGTEFDSPTWPQDALRLLSKGAYDVVHLFSHAVHLRADGDTTHIWTGLGYNYVRGLEFDGDRSSPNFWFSGLAWAYTREAIERARIHFQKADFAWGIDELKVWRSPKDENPDLLAHVNVSDVYKQSILCDIAHWQQHARVGYVPGVARQVDALACFGLEYF